MEEDHPEVPYTGSGKLKRSNSGIEAYFDEECKLPVSFGSDDTATLSNIQLKQPQKQRLYAKGKSTGATELILSLDDQGDSDDVGAGDQDIVTVEVGEPAHEEVDVKELNVVTPHLEVEYKVVLLEKNLAQFQDGKEDKIFAAPTYIQVHLTETKPNLAYKKGGYVKCDPPNADVYLDKECTKKLEPTTALTNDQLTKSKLKLYLKGTKAGKFDLTLELEKTTDKFIKLAKPAKEEMGVVDLDMELHQYNTANPPAQVAMSGIGKAKIGRLLHIQNTDKEHARAKMVIKKLNPGHWPDGCDSYKAIISVTTKSGDVGVFDAEEAGTAKAFPIQISKSDLDKADQTYWIEGKKNSKGFRELRIDLGLDRSPGGLSKEIKRNGDWARFTVVQLEKIAPEEQFDKPSAEYNSDKYRVYINLKADPVGRNIKIKTKLTEKLQGIRIHFMLAPDKDNGKAANYGQDLPATWNAIGDDLKHKDKANKADTLHLWAQTDADGVAEKELTLSRFGGDIFYASAYVSQDAHLAGYIHGDATHGKKKPIMSKKIGVWRKIWYQITSEEGSKTPDPSGAKTAYDAVKVELIKSDTKEYKKADVPPRTYYPEWMVDIGGGDNKVSVIGKHNKSYFYGLYNPEPDKPVKAHLIVSDHEWDPKGNTDLVTVEISSNPSGWITMSKSVFNPPLQGGSLVVQGEWQESYLGIWVKKGNLYTSNIIIDKTRTSRRRIKVKLPAGATTPTPSDKIRVKLQLKAADGPYLGESIKEQMLVVYDKVAATAPPYHIYDDVVVHEIGHSVNQTPKKGEQHPSLPEHPNWFQGQGVHCNYDNKKCVMYESMPQSTAIHRFCKVCHPYLLSEDMSKFV